jgi:hypothetical protein
MQMVVPSRVVNPIVLREWEEMHRPPPLDQPILPSGPVRGRRVVGMVDRQSNMLNKNRRWKGRREGGTSNFQVLFCILQIFCRSVHYALYSKYCIKKKRPCSIIKSHSPWAEGLLLMEIMFSVCLSVIILSPLIGRTVQKLVSHWLRLGAMFQKRSKIGEERAECYI